MNLLAPQPTWWQKSSFTSCRLPVGVFQDKESLEYELSHFHWRTVSQELMMLIIMILISLHISLQSLSSLQSPVLRVSKTLSQTAQNYRHTVTWVQSTSLLITRTLPIQGFARQPPPRHDGQSRGRQARPRPATKPVILGCSVSNCWPM